MTLHLSAAEEANESLAGAIGASLPGDQPILVDLETPAFATAVATDGRVVKLVCEPDGGVTLHIAGRSNPVRFDRFQAGALRAAFAELPGPGDRLRLMAADWARPAA